jgi:hypothetical protein
MNRRDLIALLGCAVAWLLGAYGQQGSGIRRIAKARNRSVAF